MPRSPSYGLWVQIPTVEMLVLVTDHESRKLCMLETGLIMNLKPPLYLFLKSTEKEVQAEHMMVSKSETRK